jgi:hypothetical protein
MAIKVIPDEELAKMPAENMLVVVTRIPEGGTIPAFDDQCGFGQNVESSCDFCGCATYERPYNPKQFKRICIQCLVKREKSKAEVQ